MFLLIDTANLDTIARAMESFPLAGVTTCPSLIVKEKRKPLALLREIRALIGKDLLLHAQVMGETCDEMLKDACAMCEAVAAPFFVKVPVTLEGFKAMKRLHAEGIRFTATTIHSTAQAVLAAELGADYLAPYVNRIDNMGSSGAAVVRETAEYLRMHGLPAKLLAASFRNERQILDVLLAGAHTVTLSPDLVWKMAEHPMTDLSVAAFRTAWDEEYGAGHNVADLR